MKILFLNQTFHPDVAATAQYASDLAATLVDRGHQVTVLCGRRKYDDGPAERYVARETWRGVDIRRISGTRLGKTARWRRAIDFGSYIVNCCLHLAMMPRYDVVIGLTSPPLISFIGSTFTKLKGGRFVFWVMDLNPDEAVAAGWLRERALITRALQWMLTDSARHASLVVPLDDYMAERLRNKGVRPEQIEVLPPWTLDQAAYDQSGRSTFRRAHDLDGKFVVMYSGNHSPCHPLKTLLDAAIALRHRTDIVFAFVGGGSELATVRRVRAEHQLANVTVLPYQPLDQLSASLSAADLHVVVMGEPFVGTIHPSKVYNIRALGVPYLYIGPAASHVSALEPAYTAEHGRVADVVGHIEAAAAKGVGVRAAFHDLERHSRAFVLGQLLTSLERVGSEQATVANADVSGRPALPAQPARPAR